MKNAQIWLIKGDWLGKARSVSFYPDNEVVFRWFGPEEEIETISLIFEEESFIQELKEFITVDKPEVMIVNVDEGSAEVLSSKDFEELFGEKGATKG
jgi:hypothetical protein